MTAAERLVEPEHPPCVGPRDHEEVRVDPGRHGRGDLRLHLALLDQGVAVEVAAALGEGLVLELEG